VRVLFREIAEEKVVSGAVILPVCEGSGTGLYARVDRAVGGLLKKVGESDECKGRLGRIAVIHASGIKAERLMLVGLGKKAEITPERLRQAGGKALGRLKEIGVTHAALSTRLLSQMPRSRMSPSGPVACFVEGALLSDYQFDAFKKREHRKRVASITVLSRGADFAVEPLLSTVSSVYLARDLVNTPPNAMTPAALARTARSLAGGRLSVKVLTEREISREGMHAYLSVSAGSHQPPRFIVMEYKGARKRPVVLIGKSITFDSGGISIKPAEGMEKMKYDMAGGAAVLGVMKALASRRMAAHVVGILPAAENLPGGGASRPGDVVKTMNGRTIEIVSTDAEGRMTLADAIAYAIQYYRPEVIIDIATLTGACAIAFGNEAIAMMGNSEDVMARLKRASEDTYERVWQMPLHDEYKEYLKSETADMKNSGGRKGSLCASGYFLKGFAGRTPWVHLDIAGMAWLDKERPYSPKGATGVGVRLLLRFLEETR
jgi:leucyl aminopeptidase